MLKQITVFLGVLMILCCFAACNSGSSTSTPQPETPAQGGDISGYWVVYFSGDGMGVDSSRANYAQLSVSGVQVSGRWLCDDSESISGTLSNGAVSMSFSAGISVWGMTGTVSGSQMSGVFTSSDYPGLSGTWTASKQSTPPGCLSDTETSPQVIAYNFNSDHKSLTIHFSKAMQSYYGSTGDYQLHSYSWETPTSLVMTFSSWVSGGTITLDHTKFIDTDGNRLISDYTMVFPAEEPSQPGTFSNASLSGAWLFGEDDRVYFLFDGNGTVLDTSGFSFINGRYDVASNGAYTLDYYENDGDVIHISGQVLSTTSATLSTSHNGGISGYMDKVVDMSVCAGTWSGIISGYSGINSYSISVTIDKTGTVTSVTGLTGASAGRFFGNNGAMAGVLRSPQMSDIYQQMGFRGTISEGIMSGSVSFDNGSGDDASFQLFRQ